MKDDTISRQEAIKAADSIIERDTSGNNDVVKAMTAWKEYIKGLPSAQPSVSKSEMVGDFINRKAAIKTLMAAKTVDPSIVGCASNAGVDWCIDAIKALPSAQPGWTYIEEALPKTIINEHTHDFQEYNCLCDFGEYGFDVRTYKFGNRHFWNGGGIVDKYVTAWQPLPEIPDALKPQLWKGDANDT